jgi:hypothetical protein
MSDSFSDLQFLVDRAVAAHQSGHHSNADGFARAAETLIRNAHPKIANDIARAASSKGGGGEIAERMVMRLGPDSVPALALRRRPVASKVQKEIVPGAGKLRRRLGVSLMKWARSWMSRRRRRIRSSKVGILAPR